jgi:ABC-type Fe3+/spermidine/putrescine transport system ATPase subunit
MTGAMRPDAGRLRLDGVDVDFRNTADAVSRGVAVVAQELSLFPHLDILDNLFPMREPRRGPFISRRRMRERALPVLEELSVARPLHSLRPQPRAGDQASSTLLILRGRARSLQRNGLSRLHRTREAQRLATLAKLERGRCTLLVYGRH